uniref:F-box domain-containing protein n=1 Tax=Mycena chlorophos TaxID=658473 RepID=A0ABQ0LNJ3_MYCCL|nr:predicted protein [Mycena chlorophos]
MAGPCRAFELPPELIAEIFEACLPPYPLCPDIHTSSTDSPLHLGHICREWRAIALSTPSLWRAIGMDATLWGQPLFKHLHLVKLFLERSGSWPLSVRLRSNPGAGAQRILLDTLGPHRQRLQYLVLGGDLFVFSKVVGSLPQLRGAEFVGYSESPLVHLSPLEVPTLSSLSLWGVSLASVPSPHQLTKLCLTG